MTQQRMSGWPNKRQLALSVRGTELNINTGRGKTKTNKQKRHPLSSRVQSHPPLVSGQSGLHETPYFNF